MAGSFFSQIFHFHAANEIPGDTMVLKAKQEK
jgi:hypothetical protein